MELVSVPSDRLVVRKTKPAKLMRAFPTFIKVSIEFSFTNIGQLTSHMITPVVLLNIPPTLRTRLGLLTNPLFARFILLLHIYVLPRVKLFACLAFMPYALVRNAES